MGMSMTIGANPPDPAAREIIRVGRDLLHGSAAMFYWVDDRLQLGSDVMVSVKVQVAGAQSAAQLIDSINTVEKALRARYPQIRWSFFEPDHQD